MALTLFVNTYLEDPTDYLSDDPAWNESSYEEQERALVNATKLLDTMLWVGTAVSSDQLLAWPRTEFSYFDPVLNLYVTVAEEAVPRRLEKAVAQLAVHLLRYPELEKGYEASYDSITVGPISLTNSNASSDPGRIPKIPMEVLKLISPFTREDVSSTVWWRAN